MSSDDEGDLEVGPVMVPPRAVLGASPSKSATHRAILIGALTPHSVIEDPLVSDDTIASIRMAICLGARVTAEPRTEAARRMFASMVPDGALPRFEAKEPGLHPAAVGDNDVDLPTSWVGIDLGRFIAPFPTRIPRPLLAARFDLHVERYAHRPEPRVDQVDLQNSGTTMRLGSAISALGTFPVTITGDDSLLTRPMAPLVEALGMLGVEARADGKAGRPPIHIKGPIVPGATSIRGDVSSQYISALLIAAQRADGPVAIEVTTPLKSAPYVGITERTLATFGGQTRRTEHEDRGPTFHVDGPRDLSCTRYRVPGDYSSVAFPLVAAAITGGEVTIVGLDRDDVQGDRAVLDVLERAGCNVSWEPDAERSGTEALVVRAPEGGLRAFDHGFGACPDLFPALAVLAAASEGTSRLHDAGHVRLKECDRVAAMANGLATLGYRVEESDDGLVIHGDPDHALPAARIDTHDDHRILMAFAVLGLRGPGPIWLTHPACYHVSYPRFRSDLDLLGGESRIVESGDVDKVLADQAVPEADA